MLSHLSRCKVKSWRCISPHVKCHMRADWIYVAWNVSVYNYTYTILGSDQRGIFLRSRNFFPLQSLPHSLTHSFGRPRCSALCVVCVYVSVWNNKLAQDWNIYNFFSSSFLFTAISLFLLRSNFTRDILLSAIILYILSASTFIAQITWIIEMREEEEKNTIVYTNERVCFVSCVQFVCMYLAIETLPM